MTSGVVQGEPDPPVFMPNSAPMPQSAPTHLYNGGNHSMVPDGMASVGMGPLNAPPNYYHGLQIYHPSVYSSPYSRLPQAQASPSLRQSADSSSIQCGPLQPAVRARSSEQPVRSSIKPFSFFHTAATMVVSALNSGNYKDRYAFQLCRLHISASQICTNIFPGHVIIGFGELYSHFVQLVLSMSHSSSIYKHMNF